LRDVCEEYETANACGSIQGFSDAYEGYFVFLEVFLRGACFFEAASLEPLTDSDAAIFANQLLTSNRSLMLEEFLRDLEALMSDPDVWDLNPQVSAILQGLSGLDNPFIDAC
jgi:hypothetical protein